MIDAWISTQYVCLMIFNVFRKHTGIILAASHIYFYMFYHFDKLELIEFSAEIYRS